MDRLGVGCYCCCCCCWWWWWWSITSLLAALRGFWLERTEIGLEWVAIAVVVVVGGGGGFFKLKNRCLCPVFLVDADDG